MDVGSLPAHGIEQAGLIASFRERTELNSGAIGSEPAEHPWGPVMDAMIVDSDGPFEEARTENL